MVETFATLLNRKIVIPSSKTNYIAVDKDFWQLVIAPVILSIDLDEDWYLVRYPDVSDAIKKGILRDARQHYSEIGYFEHRMPYAIKADSDWYLAQYPDINEAVSNKVFRSAQHHFEDSGFREGRFPYPDFALRRKGEQAA